MSDIVLYDVISHLNDFTYEEKKTLFQAVKLSMKSKPRKFKMRRENNKEPVITNSLVGIFKNTDITIEEIREERLARQ
ncbi:MAG: hypothetical protein J6W76_07080 [Spirochaetales bacterium]|nr:hypothetical protein [Spirochaetales bacterium]